MSAPPFVETPAPPAHVGYEDVPDEFADSVAEFVAIGRDIARMVRVVVACNKRTIASHRYRTARRGVVAAE